MPGQIDFDDENRKRSVLMDTCYEYSYIITTVLSSNKISAMDRIEEDATPAEEWLQSLNSTCNRLSTQFLNMLRAASSVSALDESQTHDPRGESVCQYRSCSTCGFLLRLCKHHNEWGIPCHLMVWFLTVIFSFASHSCLNY
jgi:hypothetical protein